MFTSLVLKTMGASAPVGAPQVPSLGAASSTDTNVGYSSAGVVTYPQACEPMTAMSGKASSSVTPTINNSTKSSGFGGTGCTQVANDEAIASVIQANEGDAKWKTEEFFGPSNVANPNANVANTAPKTPPDDDFNNIIDTTLKEDDCNTLSDLNMATSTGVVSIHDVK